MNIVVIILEKGLLIDQCLSLGENYSMETDVWLLEISDISNQELGSTLSGFVNMEVLYYYHTAFKNHHSDQPSPQPALPKIYVNLVLPYTVSVDTLNINALCTITRFGNDYLRPKTDKLTGSTISKEVTDNVDSTTDNQDTSVTGYIFTGVISLIQGMWTRKLLLSPVDWLYSFGMYYLPVLFPGRKKLTYGKDKKDTKDTSGSSLPSLEYKQKNVGVNPSIDKFVHRRFGAYIMDDYTSA